MIFRLLLVMLCSNVIGVDYVRLRPDMSLGEIDSGRTEEYGIVR